MKNGEHDANRRIKKVEALKRNAIIYAYNSNAPVKVTTVKPIWENRPRSNIIKWMSMESKTPISKIAEYLGTNVRYLDTKFNRDSITIDDLLIAAHACGYKLALLDSNEWPIDIDMVEYFTGYDEDALKRVEELDMQDPNKAKQLYEEMKLKMQKMKQEYGFED